MRLLYICGITPEWPAALRPLPPLDTGAPHGNILRLVECLAAQPSGQGFELSVVSAAAPGQRDQITAKWPSGTLQGHYTQVTVSESLRRWSAWWLQRLPLSSGFLNRLWGAHSWQSLAYLVGLRRLYARLRPDWVVLDDAPQYIRGLAHFVPRRRLIFYCRGDMGSSRRFLHWPALILVTNQPLGAWVQQINPQVARLAVVPNSLPGDYRSVLWNPERFHRPRRTLLYAGRIVPGKGLQHLLEAFGKIYPIWPDARLVIIGAEHPAEKMVDDPTPGSYEAQMRALAARLLPAGAVEWRGWLPAGQLIHEYEQAYLAVYPSTVVEGFGMVALEAMACGTPVIVSRRPGFASLVGQGGGLIVDDPADIAGLSQAMQTLLQDPALAQDLGFQGFQVARNYSVERAAQSFVTALSALPL
jgi:glycosyltransferase involved in cell wall biosynthesis